MLIFSPDKMIYEIFSQMSHFSPPGLFSHSSLSSQSGNGPLPHIKHDFNGSKESSSSNKNKCKKSNKLFGQSLPFLKPDLDDYCAADAKKKEPHIKKPLNAFMIYMKDMRPVVQAECTLKESAAINQLLGRRVRI